MQHVIQGTQARIMSLYDRIIKEKGERKYSTLQSTNHNSRKSLVRDVVRLVRASARRIWGHVIIVRCTSASTYSEVLHTILSISGFTPYSTSTVPAPRLKIKKGSLHFTLHTAVCLFADSSVDVT